MCMYNDDTFQTCSDSTQLYAALLLNNHANPDFTYTLTYIRERLWLIFEISNGSILNVSVHPEIPNHNQKWTQREFDFLDLKGPQEVRFGRKQQLFQSHNTNSTLTFNM